MILNNWNPNGGGNRVVSWEGSCRGIEKATEVGNKTHGNGDHPGYNIGQA